MPLDHSELRHRITIQKPRIVQDPDTGSIRTRWVDVATNIAAKVEFLSAREFVSSQQMQSQVSARIKVRFSEDLDATMRVLHGTRIFNPQAWIPDNESGREWLTAPCTEGTSKGD